MIIKQSPEDFIVEEIPVANGSKWDDAGSFAVFRLTKIGLNTEQAIEIISRRFHIPSSTIKYSGTKDKHARTSQYISIPSRNNIGKIYLDEDNLKLEHVGFNDEPLSLGTLKGNRFIITIRDLNEYELAALNRNKIFSDSNSDKFFVPNYFDEQRFSSNNLNIGVCLLKKDFKGALMHVCESSDVYADKARIYLAARPNDYIGALQHVPKKILLMFIHAVQSFIFNEALGRILSENASNNNAILHKILPYSLGNLVFYYDSSKYLTVDNIEKLQLIGFNTLTMNHHIKKILTEKGLVPRDFIIRALPDLSVEGTDRECFIEVKGLVIEILDNRAIISFELPKGAYATNVIKALTN